MKNKRVSVDKMNIPYLINSINFQLKNGEFKKGNIQEEWLELITRLKKISWDERLIAMYNEDFYEKYVKTGVLQKKFEHKNGVPINWEFEDEFRNK
jgi:hypothetical protein